MKKYEEAYRISKKKDDSTQTMTEVEEYLMSVKKVLSINKSVIWIYNNEYIKEITLKKWPKIKKELNNVYNLKGSSEWK